MDTSVFAIIIIVLILAAAVIVYTYYADRKRALEFEQLSREMGFTFDANGGDLEGLFSKQVFRLFGYGHRKRIRNTLGGKRREVEVRLFEYTYTTGSGKNQSSSSQTVALYTLEGQALPDFEIKPEGLFDKLASKLGRVEIDFAEDAEFSNKFQLTSADETAVRSLFGMAVRGWFTVHRGISVEAADGRLLVYRRNKRVAPQNLRQFYEECSQLVDYLCRPSFEM